MRRPLLTLSAVLALVVLAQPADAQIKFGAHGAMITSLDEASALDGRPGGGVRVMLDPPLFPLALVGSGTFYKPDCSDCSYWTATVAAQLRLPLPMVAPYVTAGWQLRRSSASGTSNDENGAMVGVGVQVNLGVALFLEGTFEFNEEITGLPDLDNNPIVIKGGVLVG